MCLIIFSFFLYAFPAACRLFCLPLSGADRVIFNKRISPQTVPFLPRTIFNKRLRFLGKHEFLSREALVYRSLAYDRFPWHAHCML